VGLFYSVPPDLKGVESIILAAGQQISLRSKGASIPGLANELMTEAADQMQQIRERLSSEGRLDELKRFRKHLLKVGGYMDNGPFNHIYRPFVCEIIP
jgi:hypothetical protein